MARKIDVRRILEEKIKGTSTNGIATTWHLSKFHHGCSCQRHGARNSSKRPRTGNRRRETVQDVCLI